MSNKREMQLALGLVWILLSVSVAQAASAVIWDLDFQNLGRGSNDLTKPEASAEIIEPAIPGLSENADGVEIVVLEETFIDELVNNGLTIEEHVIDENEGESLVESSKLENDESVNQVPFSDISITGWSFFQRGNLNFGHWIYQGDNDSYKLADTLRVSTLAGDHLGTSSHFDFPDATQEVVVSFCMRMGENWNASEGGKLPGFSGDTSLINGGQGGSPANGENAWSARMQFGKFDEVNSSVPLGFYVYHTEQSYLSRYGDTEWWASKPDRWFSEAARISKNRWYSITQRIRMNTAYQSNGVLEAWINDEMVYSRDDLNFTNNEIFREVHRFWLNVYVGGSVPAASDQTAFFSEFKYSFGFAAPENNCESLNLGNTFETTADPNH